jgi:hypothetical protein
MGKSGWIVNVERCGYLDSEPGAADASVFNVNLVRPWTEAQAGDDPVRGPKWPGLVAEWGELLFPWRWTPAGVGWQVWGNAAAVGAPPHWKELKGVSVLPGTRETIDAKELGALRDAVQGEIEKAASACDYPLSQGLEDFWGTESRSLVHSLAPLTHWPARISSEVLQMSWFIAVADPVVAQCREFAILPDFEMKKAPQADAKLKPGQPERFTGDLTGRAKTEVVSVYSDPRVAFVCLAASKEGLELRAGTLQLSQGLLSRSAIRAAVWDFLLPIHVLRRWLHVERGLKPDVFSDPAVRPSAWHLLWKTLGMGTETGDDRANVVEFLLNEQESGRERDLRAKIQALQPTPAEAGEALLQAAAQLSATAVDARRPDWTADHRQRWTERLARLQALAAASGADDQFTANWLAETDVVVVDETATEVYGAWLATVLKPVLQGFPTVGTGLEQRLTAPVRFRGDLWARARAAAISPAQWRSADLLARTLTPGMIDGQIPEAAIKDLTAATLQHLETQLQIPRAGGAPSGDAYEKLKAAGIEDFVRERVKALAVHLLAQLQGKRPRSRDRGLRLDFSGWDAPDTARQDQSIRGYAVALAAGFVSGGRWHPDAKKARWLTDTAMRYTKLDGTWDWLSAADAGGGAANTGSAWMHETVGSTMSDGERIVSVEYEGVPIATTVTNDKDEVVYDKPDGTEGALQKDDGFQAVEFAWRASEQSLPLLGYGLAYKAVATPLDNAGAAVDPVLRSGPAQLTPAPDLGNFAAAGDAKESFHFRSSEPPGKPVLKHVLDPAKTVIDAGLYELSGETQAHAYQAAHVEGLQRDVALLTADTHWFPKTAQHCSFRVEPPGSHFAFIERWINTDRVLVANNQAAHVSDPQFKNVDSRALRDFAQRFRETKEKGVGGTASYHPAVRAIGVQVWSPAKSKAVIVPFDPVSAGLTLSGFALTVDVQAVAAPADLDITKDAGGRVVVQVPQGRFVRVRLFSLVPEKFFASEGTNGRFAEGIQIAPQDAAPEFAADKYAAFGPSELWFETLPQWNPALLHAKATVTLDAPREDAGGLVSPNLVTARIDFGAEDWAPWVKGVHAQQHEWHWTGYPVEFPRASDDLSKWLPSLAGVESFRKVIDPEFTTGFARPTSTWKIGADASNGELFHRWELPAGRRPARYGAVFVRPMLRFRRLMNPRVFNDGPVLLERKIWAAGSLIAGRAEAGTYVRLPTPVLRHAIPLTATYDPEHPRRRDANGVLLVLNEAIRRTDDLAAFGGISDTIELDLVESRVGGLPELGNNPIMHPLRAPAAAATGLSLKPAIGLGFDIGRNPKVAQTALVVQPVGGNGQWLLAKARLRRVLLPETELGTLVTSQGTASRLANRIEGEEVIPPDFAVDVDGPALGELKLAFPGQDTVTVKLPTHDPGAFRYVLSWHKGRWGTGEAVPRWRCQALLQEQTPAGLEWRTVNKVSCDQNGGSQVPLALSGAECRVEGPARRQFTLRRIRLSDYTDPQWLTFIGSFGSRRPAAYEDLVVTADGAGGVTLQVRPESSAALPALQGLDASLAWHTDPSFHLLLVTRPTSDVTRDRAGPEAGMLVGAYWMRAGKFESLPYEVGAAAEANLDGCCAHILALQRVTALSDEEVKELQKIGTLPQLLAHIFPTQELGARESLARFLPEFIGPIPVEKRGT